MLKKNKSKTSLDSRLLKSLLKQAIEACGPDLRSVMATPRRAKVVAVKPAGGSYVCSVQAVLADNRPDPNAPIIPDVEIPLMWAGPNRGLVCPPSVGEFCDINFYDGDPNKPFITNFRPNGQAPAADLDSLMLQHSHGIRIGFMPDGTFIVEAPKVEVRAADYVDIKAANRVSIEANLIELKGRVEVTGGIYQKAGKGGSGGYFDGQLNIKNGGLHAQGNVSTNSNMSADGNVSAKGRIDDLAGNSNHHSH